MDERGEVLLLAGRLGLDDDGWPLLPLLDRLESLGVAVSVICLSGWNSTTIDPRVKEMPILGHRWLGSLGIRNLIREWRAAPPRLIHAIHEEMAGPALALAEALQIPYVLSIDDFEVVSRGLKLSRRWCRGLVISGVDLADELLKELGLPPERLNVIPPGIFPPLSVQGGKAWGVPVIGTAGPPVASSGFGCFLDAAQLVLNSGRDTEFLIAIQGEDATDLRRHAHSRDINERVTVADFAVVGDRFWSALDVFCQPSLVPSTGRTLALAMVSGVPSIASDVKGLHSLIESGRSGLLVPPDDPVALAEAMLRLLDRPVEADQLARQGREAIHTRFNPEREADLLVGLYGAVAEQPGRDRSTVRQAW